MRQPPEKYHRDNIRLTAIGSSSLYAYWEIGNRKRWLVSQHLKRDWSEMGKGIRMYDVTWIHFDGHNANGMREIGVAADEDGIRVDGLQPNTTYMADFGVWTADGQFIPIVRSNAVHMPRDRAPREDEAAPEPRETFAGSTGRRLPPRYFENFEVGR